jgi:ribonucleoside-diphosphate reductase alpha chain
MKHMTTDHKFNHRLNQAFYNKGNTQQQQQHDDEGNYPEIDIEKNLSDAGKSILADRYLLDGETPRDAFIRVAEAYSDNKAHAKRLFEYFSRCWAFPASPVLANGGTLRGLPISCFINDVDDSREGLGDHYHENLWLSTSGGGIGTNWSNIRSVGTSTSKGNQTTGVIPFIKVVDSLTVASWQGSTRRGATAVYLDVSHPEIEEFIELRKPTGDSHRRSQNIHHGVSIPDSFMQAVIDGTEWELIDPHTGEQTKTVDARSLWMKILTTRIATGEPYLFFSDTANKSLPKYLKDKDLKIKSSNLCTEIMLPTSPERTAVCCLSSLNLEFYDEWKDTTIVEDMLRFLDNVLEDFIGRAPDYMWRSKASAALERSVGLGAMGFHLFLQKKGVAFESAIASSWNRKIFKDIKEKTDAANRKLGHEKGSPKDLHGTGLRFAHTQAIAPNANISILCGNTSPSIEPWSGNAFTQKTQSGVFPIHNKSLDLLFRKKYKKSGKELDKIWQSVIVNEGSVQHLNFLDEHDKLVYKTFNEIDQSWVIEHAAIRQEFIDQGQSVNIALHPEVTKGDLHKLHKMAWEKGLKSLYYCRTSSVRSTENISGDCLSCEG